MRLRTTSTDFARGALFGAAGLLLPVVFHALHLGQIFMPMYLPLVALGFFAGPRTAGTTGLIVPLLSGALTGMPPFYPPIAPIMGVEIGCMAMTIAWMSVRRPSFPILAVLIPVLLAGRGVNYGLTYACGLMMDLPAGFLAGLSFFAGWPGLLLIAVVVPTLVRIMAPPRGIAAEIPPTE
jgi:hypothetical protein